MDDDLAIALVLPRVLHHLIDNILIHTELAIAIFQFWPTFQVPHGPGQLMMDGHRRSFALPQRAVAWDPVYMDDRPLQEWRDSHPLVMRAICEHIYWRNTYLVNILQLALVSKTWRIWCAGAVTVELHRSRNTNLSILFPLQLQAGEQHRDLGQGPGGYAFSTEHGREAIFNDLEQQLFLAVFHTECDSMGTSRELTPLLCPHRRAGVSVAATTRWELTRHCVWPGQDRISIRNHWFLKSEAIPRMFPGQLLPQLPPYSECRSFATR